MEDRSLSVRIPVEFDIRVWSREAIKGVVEISLNEEETVDLSDRPSVVVCRAREGESVWRLAKKYCSSSELITEANALGDGAVLKESRIIIIPKKR